MASEREGTGLKSRWYFLGLGLAAAVLLLAAACAPAAKPAPAQQPAAPQGQTTAPSDGKASSVVEQPAPAAQKPAAPSGATTAKGPTSVSGVPLDPNAKFGGTLLLGYDVEGPTFNAWEEAHGNSYNLGHPVANMIIKMRSWGTTEDMNKGAYWELWPDLATSWEQSTDGMSWTIKFREGPTFAEGSRRTPFTCRDAKWTLDSIRTGQGLRRSPRAIHFLAVDSIQCADDRTMIIKMKRPKASLAEMIGMGYNIVYPAYKYENNTDLLRDKPPIGTGPFILTEWVPGEKYVFAKREDYWDKPFPYIDSIEYRVLARTAQGTAHRAGRLDISGYGGQWGGPQADALIKECDQCAISPRVTNIGWGPVEVNHQRPPWNTPEVKDAISLAFDRAKALKVISAGWGVLPTCGILHPGTQWCTADLEQRVKQIPGYNFDTPEENKAKAREILTKAGYKTGELSFKYSFTANSAAPVTFKEDLDSVGFNVVLDPVPVARIYDLRTNAQFDVHAGGYWVAGTDPDVALYEHFYTGSDRNYGRYSNPEVDRLIDQMSQTVDPTLRRQRAQEISLKLLRDHAKIINFYSDNVMITSKRLKNLLGMPASLTYGPVNRFDHVWLETK